MHVETRSYRCLIRLHPEADGFSASCPMLPGAVSEGDSEAEATANVQEALAGVIEEYLAEGVAIPWQEILDENGNGDIEKWVTVNV